MTTEPRMLYHLLPKLGSKLMSSISRDLMQELLDEKATNLSRSIVDHLRWDLRAIFKLAQCDGVVPSNPADGLHTPPCRAEAEKRVLNAEQILLALSVLDQRERLIFRMAVFDGMRPGEIFAVRLGKIGQSSVLVDQRVYKGDLDTPKGRKGKRTSRIVGLAPGTIAGLAEWRKLLPNQAPEAWLFPSEKQTPLRRDNVWRKNLAPRLEKVGLEWATFQVLRRTNASLSRKAKVDDKVAADQRGHGLGVSLEVYSISDLDQKIEAVRRLESQVIQ